MVLDHLNDAELERFLAKKAKDAALTPSNPPPQFPVRTVRDVAVRATRAGADAGDATLRAHETHERSVHVTGNEIDPRTWLRQQYTNEEGIMFCQMQGDAPLLMPFKS